MQVVSQLLDPAPPSSPRRGRSGVHAHCPGGPGAGREPGPDPAAVLSKMQQAETLSGHAGAEPAGALGLRAGRALSRCPRPLVPHHGVRVPGAHTHSWSRCWSSSAASQAPRQARPGVRDGRVDHAGSTSSTGSTRAKSGGPRAPPGPAAFPLNCSCAAALKFPENRIFTGKSPSPAPLQAAAAFLVFKVRFLTTYPDFSPCSHRPHAFRGWTSMCWTLALLESPPTHP